MDNVVENGGFGVRTIEIAKITVKLVVSFEFFQVFKAVVAYYLVQVGPDVLFAGKLVVALPDLHKSIGNNVFCRFLVSG